MNAEAKHSGPVDVLAVLDDAVCALQREGNDREASDLLKASAAVAELQRVSIFVSGRIFRWRIEGSAPSYREWMETEEMLDNAIAALANIGSAP